MKDAPQQTDQSHDSGLFDAEGHTKHSRHQSLCYMNNVPSFYVSHFEVLQTECLRFFMNLKSWLRIDLAFRIYITFVTLFEFKNVNMFT